MKIVYAYLSLYATYTNLHASVNFRHLHTCSLGTGQGGRGNP